MRDHGRTTHVSPWPAWLVCVALTATVGCGPAAKPDAGEGSGAGPDSAVPLVFEPKRYEETVQDCPEHVAPCASVVIEYPVPGENASERARAALAAYVAERVLRPIEGYETEPDPGPYEPEALAQQFLSDYRDFVAEYPDAPAGWTLQRVARPIWSGSRGFSLEFEETSYTGGAHPNTTVDLVSIDIGRGVPLTLEDLIAEDRMDDLRELAESAFRRAHDLAVDADLMAAGFWFEDGRFQLNSNFAVTDEGLRFYFNPYEVAPHAMGPTDITLTRASLKGVARANGWLDVHGPV
jgi:hypothetical protein